LGSRTTRTWEFNSTSPIRSMTFNMVLWGGPLYLLKLFDFVFNFITGWTIIGPYIVNVLPRMVMLALSFISDYTVYQICVLYKHSYNQCLTTLASSYVMLIYSTRTFSNSVEMAFVSGLIYMVAHCLKRTSETVYLHSMVYESYVQAETPKEKAKIKKKEKLIPPHDFKFFIPISVLVSIGIFNRPTFALFAFVPLFYWFLRGVANNSIITPFQMFNFRMASLVPGVLITTLIIVLCDSLYFGELTFKKLWHLTMDWNDWKVTPFQFVMYNVVPGNLDQHGSHPLWLHSLVNLQILYGPLGICTLISVLNFFAEMVINDWKNKPGVRTIYALTMFTFIVSLGGLSIFPHQEPRFLIPLTVPMVLMNAHKLRWKFGNHKPLIVIWYAFNIAATVFFGLVHQGGVTPAVKYIARDLQLKQNTVEANVIWSHTYMPPTFELLRISERSRRLKEDAKKTSDMFPSYFLRPGVRLNFHDMAGKDLDIHVKNEIFALTTRAKLKKNVENFIVLPIHLLEELQNSLRSDGIKFKSLAYFFPHVSLDEPPDISEELFELFLQLKDGQVLNDPFAIFDTFFNILGHFGLSVYKIESSATSTSSVNVRGKHVNSV